MQAALDKLIKNNKGRVYRKKWNTHVDWLIYLKIINNRIWEVDDRGELVCYFYLTVEDLQAKDWIYEC
jgi:hypothetical protein